MREVDRVGLVEASRDPMVHHHLALDLVDRAWVEGPAVVVQHGVGWRDAPEGARAFLCLGPPEVLGPLSREVDQLVPWPWRVVVDAGSAASLPARWQPVDPTHWHWMTTRTTPAAMLGGPEVVEVPDDEVEAVLDAANPGSFARPGTPGVEVWLGARGADGRIGSVGALLRQVDGTGHLRGIATLPAYRGHGLAAAVSTALTRRALARGSGVATLGVYTDNAVAIRLYRRLGYQVVHTFTAGLTGA